jgi:hypothetical protein
VRSILKGKKRISLDVNGKDATAMIKLESTHDNRDTIPWTQLHHWNEPKALGKSNLKKEDNY